jgi:hypothetical protein
MSKTLQQGDEVLFTNVMTAFASFTKVGTYLGVLLIAYVTKEHLVNFLEFGSDGLRTLRLVLK